MLKHKVHATLVPTKYSKKGLEAQSYSIFAMAMTLLLELNVPTDFAHAQLWQALRLESNDWLAFLISLCIATRYAMLQHNVFTCLHAHPRTSALTQTVRRITRKIRRPSHPWKSLPASGFAR
jgi:uncharacterized membrane protein